MNQMPLRKQQARTAVALRAMANAILLAGAKCLWPRARPLDPKRICIYRIGNLGDTACAIPAIGAIRRAYPHAHLTLVTSPGRQGAVGARELLDGADYIDEIVVYHADDIGSARGRLKLMRDLRAHQFDLWIELPVVAAPLATLVRNMIAARWAGARWGCGWRYDGIRVAAQAQSECIEFPDEVDRLLAIVRAGGIAVDAPEYPLALAAGEHAAAAAILSGAGLGGAPIIAFAPGAKAEPNRWPAERFVEVGRHLAARSFKIAVLGGAADAAVCGEIARAIGATAASLAGRTTVRQTCQVVAHSVLLVGNDSGVQHLAAAVGTPCLSLFSCRDFKGKWWPHGAQHVVLRKEVACHTCFLDHCPYDNRCIKLIASDEVIATADRMLARATGAPEAAHDRKFA